MPCHPKDAVVAMSRRRKIVKPRDDMTSYQLVTLNEGFVTYFVSFVTYSHCLSPYLKPCHIKHALVTISRRIISPRDDMTSYQLVTLNEDLVTNIFSCDIFS